MASTKDMRVQVCDALASGIPGIDYDPVAAFRDSHLVGDFGRGVKKVTQ